MWVNDLARSLGHLAWMAKLGGVSLQLSSHQACLIEADFQMMLVCRRINNRASARRVRQKREEELHRISAQVRLPSPLLQYIAIIFGAQRCKVSSSNPPSLALCRGPAVLTCFHAWKEAISNCSHSCSELIIKVNLFELLIACRWQSWIRRSRCCRPG